MGYLHHKTPLIESVPISRCLGIPVFLKMEALQPVGSFKLRGIGHFCSVHAERGAKLFVASSGGNAGLAVAYSGRKLGIKVQVVVPTTTSDWMKHELADEGAEVIVEGSDLDAAGVAARALAAKEGEVYVSPFNDPLIWEGHATLIDELDEKPGGIVVAVGGGGLLIGLCQGLARRGWDDVPIFTTETEGAASFAKSVAAGHVVTLDRIDTVATSIGAKRVADEAYECTKTHEIHPIVVTDAQTIEAVRRFADDARMLVEPACGTALVPIYEKSELLQQCSSLLVVVCGGAGVNLQLIDQWTSSLAK